MSHFYFNIFDKISKWSIISNGQFRAGRTKNIEENPIQSGFFVPYQSFMAFDFLFYFYYIRKTSIIRLSGHFWISCGWLPFPPDFFPFLPYVFLLTFLYSPVLQ